MPTPEPDFRLPADVAWARTDSGMVVYRASTQELLELDEMSAEFLAALERSGTIEAAAAAICTEFDAPLDVITEDLGRFIAQLAEAGLLSDQGQEPTAASPLERARARHLDVVERALVGLTDPTAPLPAATLGVLDPHAATSVPAMSMVGHVRMRNVRQLAERALADGIPGDFMECGVWRGGCAIMMRAVLDAHEVVGRSVWLADSFRGLPEPDVSRYPLDAFWVASSGRVAVPLEQVREHFRRFGLLDNSVHFLEGWFRDTLPNAPVERLALLRLDGDLYESTLDALTAMHDRVSPGGFVIIDDYYLESCRAAVDDFRTQRGITADIHHIDWTAVWWQVDA